ncbi:MAG: hypothetical protein GY822_10425, partial [Deltaproteobacteria bacterium]|nr:hypothetical protein [Deltaproteobacteria bacterium]
MQRSTHSTARPFLMLIAMASLAASFLAMSVACDDSGFEAVPQPEPDAGVEEPEPPPPPVFPLKQGDILVFPAIGGRIEPCPQREGSCDRAVRSTYEVQ